MHRAGPQPGDEDVLGGRLADDQGVVLILPVVTMKERQLLVSVGGIVGGVEVEGEGGGKLTAVMLLEPLDAGGDVEVDELLEDRGRGQVLEAAERGLAGQGVIFGQTVGEELEDRIVAEGVVIVAVFVAGQDAEDPLAKHRQQRLRRAAAWDRPDRRPCGRCSSSAHRTAARAAARRRKLFVRPWAGQRPAFVGENQTVLARGSRPEL